MPNNRLSCECVMPMWWHVDQYLHFQPGNCSLKRHCHCDSVNIELLITLKPITCNHFSIVLFSFWGHKILIKFMKQLHLFCHHIPKIPYSNSVLEIFCALFSFPVKSLISFPFSCRNYWNPEYYNL